jgi:polysaccharide pyruvyl transferase WcaK-like protein
MTRRIGIYAWAGMGNLGDDFLLETAIELISKVADEVVLLLEPEAKWNSNTNIRIMKWPRTRASFSLRKKFLNDLNQLDYLVFAGGGWLAGDRGVREPLNWYLRTRGLKVPTIGMSLGVGPFNSKSSSLLGGKIISRIGNTGLLSVRTNDDLYWVSKLGYQSSQLSTDLAFSALLPASNGNSMRQGCVVSLPEVQKSWTNGVSPSKAADKLISLLGDEVMDTALFVSFQRGNNEDYPFWAKSFPNVEKVASFTDAIKLMQSAEKVVAGRLHAGIAAVQAGVPQIALIGYHHKFNVLSDLGLRVGAWGDDEVVFSSVQEGLTEALSSRSRNQSLRIFGGYDK